ncbi:CBS domain-containing protein [Streptomyces alanosinicus]|uniref:CBS domain-containing protein n=1 Tax=Streptomyces alanosinicus TaxID=68171 RepID=A0A919D3U5_9ACTN|nr:hypothetical protein GCM10010339_47390 [Streptomyces alanosinicus]
MTSVIRIHQNIHRPPSGCGCRDGGAGGSRGGPGLAGGDRCRCTAPAAVLSGRKVRDLVHARRTVVVHPENPLPRAAAVMTQEHLDALPVTDPHGRLVGLLTARTTSPQLRVWTGRAKPVGQRPTRATLPGLAPHRAARERGIVIP